ncbi:MAG: hypothetical protein JNK48_22600 [Bryobacterales bacterium]|nr:hypothetical protein [Bryobacterales bacterium]
MRTAAFLLLSSLVFIATAYLTLEHYRLSKPIAFPIVTVTTVAFVAFWIVVQNGVTFLPTEEEKRYAERLKVYAHRGKEQKRIAGEIKAKLLAHVAGTPALARFRRQIESGEIQSADDLVYRSDAAELRTCSHLRPIEERLRQAGCTVWLIHAWNYTPIPGAIYAAAVLREFPAPLMYKADEYFDERSGPSYDASLSCSQCNSVIHCTHPDDAGAGTVRWADL